MFGTVSADLYTKLSGKNLAKICIFCSDMKIQSQKYENHSGQRNASDVSSDKTEANAAIVGRKRKISKSSEIFQFWLIM